MPGSFLQRQAVAALSAARGLLQGLDRRRVARLAATSDGDIPTRYRVTPINFDNALRYREAIELLRPLFRPDVKILEVGSGAGGVTEFLRFPVVGLDSAFDRTADRTTPYLIPVEGSADALPFEDGAFDVVLSLEMLEHIPVGKREAVLSEMFRVLRPGGRMVVTFPADDAAARLDTALNDYYLRRYDREHTWVAEHLREGHPRTDEIVALMRRIAGASGTVDVRKHDPARSWLTHQMIYGARRWFPLAFAAGAHSRLGATLLFRLQPRITGDDHYRSILVVDRSA